MNKILTEKKIIKMITEELKKSDVIDMFKHDKDFDKKIREISTEVITNLFRVLWQNKAFYNNIISKK